MWDCVASVKGLCRYLCVSLKFYIGHFHVNEKSKLRINKQIITYLINVLTDTIKLMCLESSAMKI